MKKLLLAIVVAAAAVSSSFATVELSAGLQMTPYNGIKVAGADSFYESVPLGFETQATFYFRDLRPFSVGLKLGLGYDHFSWIDDSSLRKIDGGFNAALTVGPTFRFAIPGTRSSIFVSPGFKFNCAGISIPAKSASDDADMHDTMIAMEFGFHLDACYTFWVVQNEKFGLGLNFGAGYSLGFGRAGRTTVAWGKNENDDLDLTWADLDYAQHLKLFTGVTFRIGK